MSQPKACNQNGDVFARWLTRNKLTPGSGNTRAVDSAPKDTAALAEHFIGLPLRDLRTGWPACVLDAMASGITIGALARALTVVSRRLYCVSVDERTGQFIGELDPPVHAPAPVPTPQRKAPSRRSGPRRLRLTDEEVRTVRALARSGEMQKTIAQRMNLRDSTVSHILNGQRYAEVK